MAPTAERPEMARTELWFLEAYRNFPSAFDNFETLSAIRSGIAAADG
jgi:hypothetical protein